MTKNGPKSPKRGGMGAARPVAGPVAGRARSRGGGGGWFGTGRGRSSLCIPVTETIKMLAFLFGSHAVAAPVGPPAATGAVAPVIPAPALVPVPVLPGPPVDAPVPEPLAPIRQVFNVAVHMGGTA